MRATAFLLCLLLAVAPWSGVLAHWGKTEAGTASSEVLHAAAGMPCHQHAEQADSAKPLCPRCLEHACDADNCQCPNGAVGIAVWPAQPDPTQKFRQHATVVLWHASAMLSPDSPPPIV